MAPALPSLSAGILDMVSFGTTGKAYQRLIAGTMNPKLAARSAYAVSGLDR